MQNDCVKLMNEVALAFADVVLPPKPNYGYFTIDAVEELARNQDDWTHLRRETLEDGGIDLFSLSDAATFRFLLPAAIRESCEDLNFRTDPEGLSWLQSVFIDRLRRIADPVWKLDCDRVTLELLTERQRHCVGKFLQLAVKADHAYSAEAKEALTQMWNRYLD